MLLTRVHKILVGLLVAQLALAVVMMTRADDTAAARPTPLLAGFDAAQVTRLRISTGDAPAIELVQRGDAWVLASHFDYPVDAAKVRDVLSPLARMAAAGPIATQASRHKQLRVGDTDHERKLVVTHGGKELTLFVGATAGSRRTAVRIGGEDRVYGVTGVSPFALGTQPSQWVDTAYLRVPRDEIAKVTVQGDGHHLELARSSKDAAWTVALGGQPVMPAPGEVLDTATIERLVGDASTIDLAAPGDPKRDASRPTATITIERLPSGAATPAPVVVDVLVDGDHYWVRERGRERAARVTKARLAGLLDARREQLVDKDDRTTQVEGAPRGARSG